jgi:MFS family permease
VRRIVGAYTVNRLGTWFGFVALSVAVFDHTHSALAVAAMLVSAQVLPAFLVPAVVARVETSRARALFSGLYVIEAIATIALIVLIHNFSLAAVLALVAVDGTAALAASALLRTALARAARDHATSLDRSPDAGDLAAEQAAAERSANASLNVAFSGTFVLGPAIAGAIVASAGASTALAIDVVSFLICAAMLIDLRPHVEEGEGTSVRARLKAAWAYLSEARTLRTLLVAQGIGLVFFESAAPIEVPYAKIALHAGDRGYGALLASWGIGVVIGSLFFARSPHRSLGAMISFGTLAVGLAYVGFATAPTILVACLAALLGGVGNGVQWAATISAVQRLTPQRLLGRIMGALESIGAICPALGLALGGALVAVSSPRTAFLVTGLGAVATTGAFVRLSRMGIERPPGSVARDESPTRLGSQLTPYGQEPGLVEPLGEPRSGMTPTSRGPEVP